MDDNAGKEYLDSLIDGENKTLKDFTPLLLNTLGHNPRRIKATE